MFNFGKRNVTKQGGSYMISLPMQWMKDLGTDVKQVLVEMSDDKTLKIAPILNVNPEPVQASNPVKEMPACQ